TGREVGQGPSPTGSAARDVHGRRGRPGAGARRHDLPAGRGERELLDRDARPRGQRVLRVAGPAGRVGGGRVTSKVTTMHDAVAELVHDGDTIAIEGFTHLISFAAGHEIIRQRRRDLTLARMTPDVIYDQMIGAGVASKLIFSWMGNPGVGSLHAVRRRIEHADPEPLEIEEYSHFGMVCRYVAGASRLPFMPIRSYFESDLPKVNPRIVEMASPFDPDERVYAVPPLTPDVAVVHVQRADSAGNAQIWGLLGMQR